MADVHLGNAVAGPSTTSRPINRPSSDEEAGYNHSSSDPLSRSYERLNGLHHAPAGGLEPAAHISGPRDAYGEDDSAAEEGEEGPFLVRAKFPFQASDPSALSFTTGDLIEVITMLDSGWWDGMMGEARGWFPSNFVDVVEQDELDEMERQGFEVVEDEAGSARLPWPDLQARALAHRRTILAEEALGIDDALGGGWGGEGDDLEELARSMGVGAEDMGLEGNSGGDGFMLAARRQRARADTIDTVFSSPAKSTRNPRPDSRDYGDPATTAAQNLQQLGIEEEEDFEAGLLRGADAKRREREDTAGTIKGEGGGHVTPMGKPAQDTPKARGRARESAELSAGGVGEDDAWIPCLTPDGQVYYHNTHTGEDSWEIPLPTPSEDDLYEDEETDYFPTPSSRPASSAFHTSSTPDPKGGFQAPPPADVPHPWVRRLSDDGEQWFYVNTQTGEKSFDLPQAEVAPTGGATVPPPAQRPATKESAEARAKAIASWERRSRHEIEIALRPAERSSLGIMLEIINDTLREVFEAAVAGSAAEEEMSRASDLNSDTGRVAAIAREDSAVDMLRSSHRELLSAITDLLRAYGYAGPIDRLDDMPRPPWTGDMTLIGSIGVFSANVHAALRSKRVPESGLSVWQEVMRSGSKLRDVLTDFPETATGGAPTGRPLWAWLGVEEPIGGMFSGRWGFGPEGSARRALDGDLVAETKQIRSEFEAAARAVEEGGEMGTIRIAEKFKGTMFGVDLAGSIDIDGQADGGKDDAVSAKYRGLVNQARTCLADFDQAVLGIDLHSAVYYLALCRSDPPSDDALAALTTLGTAISSATQHLSKLLAIATEQRGMISSGAKGRIGFRSPRYNQLVVEMGNTRHRPPSITSNASKGSRASGSSAIDAKRGKVRGLEDDFQEHLELSTQASQESARDPTSARRQPQTQSQQRAKRDSGGPPSSSSPPVSASGSQSSLARAAAGPSHKHQPSAGSSTTSLAYQRTDSDAGSQKGTHRASTLMKGFFGRKNYDPEAEMREKADKAERLEKQKMRERGNRKLAKLLGEEPSRLPHVVTAPQSSQQPLQRQTSLSQQPYEGRTPLSASFSSIPPAPLAETPWYLAEDYAPDEIVFDERGNVKAGTLRALVARLTPHESADTSFFQAFMLTFRSFTSGDRLFELLFERHHLQPPAGMDEMQKADWVRLKQTPIRLRVANVLRAWLDVHFTVDQDMVMLDKFEKFARESMVDTVGEMLGMLSKTLLTLIDRRRRKEDPSQRRILSGGLLSPPAPLLPRISGKQLQLTDIPPLELARQLTILEFTNFQAVRPPECLNNLWAGKDETKAPNVRMVIHTANKLAAWIGMLVLQPKDAKSRATLMKYFIQCAVELRNLNNFSSMAAITAGLNSAPLNRLKRTKEQLSAKTTAMKEDLDRTMDSSKNFANYKEMLKTINPPCVPFLGFYLTALTFIEDGNKDIIKDPSAIRGMSNSISSSSLASSHSHPGFSATRTPIQPLTVNTGTPSSTVTASTVDPSVPPKEPLINFFKRSLSAEILRDIQQYQSQPYNLAKCRPVYEFLLNGLEKVEINGGGNDLYERSMMLEPREEETERIQRMLHDSGFI